MTLVKELMHKNVAVEKETATVTKAVKKMTAEKIGSVLVVSEESIVGIVTSTDVMRKVIAKEKDPKKVKLKEIMNSPIHAIGPEHTVQDAVDMMERNKIKKLPVINEKDELLGIITATDILNAEPEFVNTLINLQFPNLQTMSGS